MRLHWYITNAVSFILLYKYLILKFKLNFIVVEYNIMKILFVEVIFMKKYINRLLIVRFILCLEIIIYCSFIYMDFMTKNRSIYSTGLKYIGILLCLIMSLMIGDRGHDKEDTKLLQIAFCFTAAADLCLVILDYNILGIFLFCFVQTTYIMRHNRGVKRKCRLYTVIVTIVLTAFICKLVTSNLHITDLVYNRLNEKLIMIGSVYSVLLFCSLYTAWKTLNGNFYPVYSRFLISIGMTLFFLCDINVGLSGVASNITVQGIDIESFSRFLVWIFYLPSQVLLVLSGYRR